MENIILISSESVCRLFKRVPLFALMVLFFAGSSLPLPLPAADPLNDITAAQVQAAIDELNALKDAAPDAKSQALGLYQTALKRLDAAKAASETAAKFKQSIATGPDETKKARDQLQVMKNIPADDFRTSLAPLELSGLQQRLTDAQSQASALAGRLAELDDGIRLLTQRPGAARNELAAERKKLDDINHERELYQPSADSPIVAKARQMSFLARRSDSIEQIARLEEELLSIPIMQDLQTAQRALVAARIDELERLQTALKSLINVKIESDVLKQQSEADRIAREVAGQHPVLAAYAKGTADLVRQTIDLAQRLDKADRTGAALKIDLQQMRDNQQTTRQIMEIGGNDQAFGQLLRELRARLPATADLARQISEGEQSIVGTRLQRIRIDEELKQLNEPDAAATRIIRDQQNRNPTLPTVTPEVKTKLFDLMLKRKEILAHTSGVYGQYIARMENLNDKLRELSTGANEMTNLFSERLMWLPDNVAIGPAWAEQLGVSAHWIFSPVGWDCAGRAFRDRITEHPQSPALVLLLLGMMLFLRPRMHSRMKAISDTIKSASTDKFGFTIEALVLTLLLALPIPLLFGFTSHLLSAGISEGPFPMAVGRGLFAVAFLSMILQTFRIMSLPNGLFSVHFGWSEKARSVLGQNLGWMLVIALPPSYLVSMCQAGSEDVRSGMGRLAFIAFSLALGIFAFRVLHPTRGAIANAIAGDNWIFRFRNFWYPVFAAAPAVLSVLAICGYYETALQLEGRLFTSGWVALLGLTVYGLSERWVMLAHQRLAVKRAITDRLKAQADQVAKESIRMSGQAQPQHLDLPEIDLRTVGEQTRTLLRVLVGTGLFIGLYLVWSRVIPALGVLDQVTIWTQVITSDHGETTVPISLLDLMQAVLIGFLTLIAARNLPGVMEIVTLQRMSLDAGTRYAITAVTRYVIVAIGVMSALHQVGVTWARVQWILAALGVGLGFGLQEIVASFIAGLIILFERRIRVGDTITINDLSGTVTRIQIRATTITDWDNREILIPNKVFMNENVVNWTLSDSITRLVLKVGIAYGSDTALAYRIMLATASANPLVLSTPEPTVFFTGFGESSLDFEIRVFVRELSKRMPLMHDLHMAIERSLRENKIEIPFPQRDIHIRTNPAALPPPV